MLSYLNFPIKIQSAKIVPASDQSNLLTVPDLITGHRITEYFKPTSYPVSKIPKASERMLYIGRF